ncbi:sensor histidine kinase [Teichococcus aestuarii]
MDVTAQHRAEQDWARAVARHERLYRELTHRVKNNFQLVSSLLRLQARRTPPEVKAALEMAGERIQSMAALHEALHQAGDAGSVPLDRYLETFAHWIIRHWMARRPVVLHVETVPASLSRDRTLPLGMAVAEMVSNALRHAFPDGRHGNIHLRLEREEDMLVLSVEDDGAGMDALAAMRSAGFGMTLLQSCARQLDGDLLTEHRPRTRFSLRFPEATPD